jgi:hypothetical protein
MILMKVPLLQSNNLKLIMKTNTLLRPFETIEQDFPLFHFRKSNASTLTFFCKCGLYTSNQF